MLYPVSQLRLLPWLVVLASLPFARAEKLVVVRSVASSDYVQRPMVDGKRQPETYVFMPGRFFAGNTHDNSLQKTSIRTIAERLTVDLRRQDYFPASSLAKADLLLVVHWGVTTGRDRDMVTLSIGMQNVANLNRASEEARIALDEANARGDLEAAGRARDDLSALASESKAETQNALGSEYNGESSAVLLGLSAELEREDDNPLGSERRKTLVGMTQEERYFVVVMAYDAPTLISTKKMKRVWTMRASIGSAGVNFQQALDRMGNIAGQYFGTKQEGVSFARTGDRERKASVQLGDLIVIDTVER